MSPRCRIALVITTLIAVVLIALPAVLPPSLHRGVMFAVIAYVAFIIIVGGYTVYAQGRLDYRRDAQRTLSDLRRRRSTPGDR